MILECAGELIEKANSVPRKLRLLDYDRHGRGSLPAHYGELHRRRIALSGGVRLGLEYLQAVAAFKAALAISFSASKEMGER